MRPTTGTTIATYILLALAGAGAVVLPDDLGTADAAIVPASVDPAPRDEIVCCGLNAADQLLSSERATATDCEQPDTRDVIEAQ